jgi:Dyp-type peroxidase family
MRQAQHKPSMGLGGLTNLAVLAPVDDGMVPGFEPISYRERLRKVFDGLHSARRNIRESELRPPVFPDAVGRFGIIHHFRYALVPPVPGAGKQPPDGVWQVSLNVTFDGGWEPYMRVIYRDIGPLLDLLFCHSPGYPGSRTSTFDDYCAWVRRNEQTGGLFYADSGTTLGDQHYLAEVEKAQRERGASDAQIARVATPSDVRRQRDAMRQAMSDPDALVLPLRTLKGLYRLSVYFPSHNGDMDVLRRFAQSILVGPRAVMATLDRLPDEHPAKAPWKAARLQLRDELAWLEGAVAAPPPAAPLPYDPARLQSHMFGRQERMTHGCVALLRVQHRDQALAHLATLSALCGPVPDSGIGHLIGFTHSGLAALGVAASRLAGFAQEFVDGMEARCGLLGDVRGNHPDHWVRPLAYDQPQGGRHRIDMKVVHVFLQLRLADDTHPGFDLHPKLADAIAALHREDNGLRVLAVQPTRSYRNGAGQTAGHFDFVDGLSQPAILDTPPERRPVAHDDAVRPGELLLGHGNDRGDAAQPGLDPLRMDGSYLVVRKLRQRVDHLDAELQHRTPDQREELLSKMMGRHRDGKPLVALPAGATGPNDFNYDAQAASDAGPFHSHVRRANPRDGRDYMPRILRRGMSYGPKSDTDRSTERGLVFMAYCASIAEQFETVQRWIAGGNSSGVGSNQADPFLRVPQIGESSTFRYLDANGQVARATFDGSRPLVELEWGLYVFVPALAALRDLDQYRTELPAPPQPQPAAAPGAETQELERMRQWLDDPDRAPAVWQEVRAGQSPLEHTAYGHLVGRHEDVLAAMKDPGRNDPAGKCSVHGYGERMAQSIGLNLLGLDPGPDYAAQAALNDAVLAIGEEQAYEVTRAVVEAVLARFPALPSVKAGAAPRRPIDLVTFSDHVMAALCARWIGLPDAQGQFIVPGGRLDDAPAIPRCPGNFATASRYIFSPHPRPEVEAAGKVQGDAVLKAVQRWLAGGPTLAALAEDIQTRLGVPTSDPRLALCLAGVLLGFPPTVQGNYVRTMQTWIEDEDLWQHQQALADAAPGASATYAEANAALRGVLLATMRRRPVPEMLWRSPADNGVVDTTTARERIVLGITSALTDPAAPDELMFGRDRPGQAPTVHGCPGYPMAMGVLLAMMAGLLKAGTLRPTGSPVLLILTPA